MVEVGGVGGRGLQHRTDLSKFIIVSILFDIVCEVIISNLSVLNRV